MAIQMVGTFSFGMFENMFPLNLKVTQLPAIVVENMEISSNIGTDVTSMLLEKYFPYKKFEVNRAPIKKQAGECMIQAVLLNKTQGKISNIEEALALEPRKDYDFCFYLIEVV